MNQSEREKEGVREGEKEAGRMRAVEEDPSVDSDNNSGGGGDVKDGSGGV